MKVEVFNLNQFPEEKIASILKDLPDEMAQNISKYRSLKDQKSRLVSKLLLKQFMLGKYGHWDWTSLEKDVHDKPFIEGKGHFNISHSGDLVIIAYDDAHKIGIDIELVKDIEVERVIHLFREEEIEYLEGNGFDKKLFYELWTKKEALSKAIGVGFKEGFNQFPVLNRSAQQQNAWKIQTIQVESEYVCSLCSASEVDPIEVEWVELDCLSSVK